MTDWLTPTVGLAIVAAIPTIITAVSLFYTRHLQVNINSRMDQLLEVVKKVAHAEGLKEGRQEQEPRS